MKRLVAAFQRGSIKMWRSPWGRRLAPFLLKTPRPGQSPRPRAAFILVEPLLILLTLTLTSSARV